jgi:hypothetical protein
LKQLQEIIVDKMKTNPGAREVLEQVDGEEVLDPDNVGSALSTLLDTICSDFEHECLDEAVRLLNARCLHQSTYRCVPGC